MANAIELAKQYVLLFDEVYKLVLCIFVLDGAFDLV